MKSTLVKSLVLLVVFATGSLAQQIDDEAYVGALAGIYPYARDFSGGGARASAMGNAFIGISDDISAVGWNPAGLYQKDNPFEQPVMGLGYGSFSAKSEFGLTGLQGAQQYNKDGVFDDANLASFLAPIRIKGHPFVFAGSYVRAADEYYNTGMRYDTALQFTPSDIEQGLFYPAFILASGTYHSGVNTLNLGFGTRLYNDVSFGLATNVYSGSAVFESVKTLDLHGIQVGFLQRAHLVADTVVTDSISYSGIYFTFGLRYSKDKLSAGLIVRTPHKLRQDVDITVDARQTINGNETHDGTEKYYFDNNVVELDMPLTVGAGIGYRLVENLLFAVDAEYRPYSGGEVRVRDSLKLVPGEKDTEYFSSLDPLWNDVFAVRVGAEYMWNTGSLLIPQVPFRAGFGYTPIPQPNVDAIDLGTGDLVASYTTSRAAMSSYTFGAGVRWDQVHLDVAYVHSSLDREAVVYEPIQQGEGEVTLVEFSTTTSTRSNTLSVTFTGYF